MLLMAVFFMSFALILSLGLANPIIKQARVALDLWKTKESYYVSESGTEDVVYRVKGNMTIGSSELMLLNGLSATTYISDTIDGKTLRTESDGSGYIKKIETKVKKGTGVSFVYGLQTGQGGFLFSNSGTINGNVYSNGDIISNNSSAKIVGTAIVANSPSLFTDQDNSAPTSSPNSITFGNTSVNQDLAQSFTVSSSSPITQVNLYLKKVGAPSNITLKIIKDAGGSPSGSSGDIVSQATISSSLITTTYGWVEVPLSSNPSLTVGSTYWLVLDSSYNSTNYYISGANLDNSYATGTAKTGSLGNTWSNSGYDSYFKIFLGGNFGKIVGVNQWNQFNISGGAWAHTVNYVNSGDFMRCQLGSMPSNNKNCDTIYPDPTSSALPVSDANIQEWKDAAAAGGTINGDYNTGTYITSWMLGPKKINGNLIIGGSSALNVTGTLWVTGNIILDGSGILRLASSYGTNSGVIVTDGRIVIPGSCTANGSGQTGSFIMLVTTSDCPTSSSCGGNYAADISGSGGAVIINAQKGTVNFGGSAHANEVTANKVVISGGGVIITYNSGLASPTFFSGPSGGFNITGWRELTQ